MYKGSKEIKCHPGAKITVRSSGQFCAYGMENNKRSLILGPMNVNARILAYKLPTEVGTVYIKTEKSTEWTLEWTFISRSEKLDATPVEMPIGYQQPESLADQMRRFIRTEVSNQRAENMGSFEEEDDFSDDEEPLTNYETTEMQEIEEIDWDENNPQSQPPAKPVVQGEALDDNPEDAETSESEKAVDKET